MIVAQFLDLWVQKKCQMSNRAALIGLAGFHLWTLVDCDSYSLLNETNVK